MQTALNLTAVLLLVGANLGCSRPDSGEPAQVVVDLHKAAGVNVCPERRPDLPHANVDLRVLLHPDTPLGKYDVVVYRAAAPSRSVGQTGIVTAEPDAAALQVNLRLAELEPGAYTLTINTRPKLSYCDVRVQ